MVLTTEGAGNAKWLKTYIASSIQETLMSAPIMPHLVTLNLRYIVSAFLHGDVSECSRKFGKMRFSNGRELPQLRRWFVADIHIFFNVEKKLQMKVKL